MNLTRLLTRMLGDRASRDDWRHRLVGALVAVAVIGLATLLVPGPLFTPQLIVVSHLVVVPLVALAPNTRFLLAQTGGAVALYLIARGSDHLSWSAAGMLLAQELTFFLVLWRAPLERVGVRQLVIATATICLIPLYYWLNYHVVGSITITSFIGGWRHFVLLVVVTATLRRDAASTVRNMAVNYFSPMPIPLEHADRPDRRLVTLIEGGLIFTTGMVMRALLKQHGAAVFGFDLVDWNADVLHLGAALLLYACGLFAAAAAVGFMLMGHCHLLGIRVAAPIGLPYQFTNLATAWRGMGFYMYRFVYDGYYRQFFRGVGAAPATVVKITALFLVMGYQHTIWGGPFVSWAAAINWTIQGLATGLTVVYLQHQTKQRIRAYVKGQRPPKPPAWHLLLVPVLVATVLFCRGLFEYALNDDELPHHIATLIGVDR